MANRPDYRAPQYDLDQGMRSTIDQMQRMPYWQRRVLYAHWSSKRTPLIYKYLSFFPGDDLSMKKARDLLVNSGLYLSAPSDFNDPYDFQAFITFDPDPVARRKFFERSARSVIKEKARGKIHGRRKLVEQLVRNTVEKHSANPDEANRVFNEIRDTNGVCCFSENPRSLLMWSHYAAGHTGICLQFDVTRDPGVLMLTQKVQYKEALPHLQWPRDKERVVEALTTKGLEWASEEEVRYISLTTVRDSIDFDGRALTGLVIGSRFPESAHDKLCGLLSERSMRGLPPLRIFRAERHLETYGVYLAKSRLFDNCSQ